jgi:hypothetical protein
MFGEGPLFRKPVVDVPDDWLSVGMCAGFGVSCITPTGPGYCTRGRPTRAQQAGVGIVRRRNYRQRCHSLLHHNCRVYLSPTVAHYGGMKREKHTAKLMRMLMAVDAGNLPARIKEFYVFGSYLDVIVVYEWPKAAFAEWLAQAVKDGEGEFEASHRLAKWVVSTIKKALRRPGESVHLALVQSVDEMIGEGSTIQRTDIKLLWSSEDRNWHAKLDEIQPDATAGRAPRDHFFPIGRLNATLTDMRRTMEKLAAGELTLTRIPIETIECDLDADHQHWLEHWEKCRVMGRESLRLLPYAMYWLQLHGERCTVPWRTEIVTESGAHCVAIGKPSLSHMLWAFSQQTALKRQCLIPHITKAGPNELLVFERV